MEEESIDWKRLAILIDENVLVKLRAESVLTGLPIEENIYHWIKEGLDSYRP